LFLVEEGCCRRWQDSTTIFNEIIDQIKESRFSLLAWSIALLLFLIVGLNPWEERGVGHGVLKVMEGEWQKMAGQGVNFQLNSLAEKNITKHNNQPTFLAHHRMVCCQELG
jgi:hypothetical protein